MDLFSTPILLTVGAGILLFGGAILLVAVRAMTTDEMSHRLQDYVTDQPAQPIDWQPAISVRRAEMEGNFRTRVLNPGFRRLGGLFGRIMPAKNLEQLDHQLMIAGNPLGLHGREFYGIRVLFIILGSWLSLLILRRGLEPLNLIVAFLAFFIGIFLPRNFLRSRVRKRQNSIRRGLPDALDMMSVCAEAGLGFDQTLQRVSEYWKTPLGIEFGRVVAEMEMGVSRQQALRNLADRLDVPELSSFVAVIIQSDKLGMSIADTLRGQAQQMRIERRFRAQEEARKVPLKMLFPMILLIFPAMMAVICGPAIPVLVELFATMSGRR